MKFIGAYTCNRCAEDHDISEVPQGMNPKVGVRSGAEGPVRRNRGDARVIHEVEPEAVLVQFPRALQAFYIQMQLIIYVIYVVLH
jgi:hypothetical protein